MKEVKAVGSETSPSSEQVVVLEGLAATRAPAGRWVPTPHEALGHRRWNDEAVGAMVRWEWVTQRWIPSVA